MNSGQLVAEALFGLLTQTRVVEHLRKSNQHRGEAPQYALTGPVIEKHGQSADGPQPTLQEFERSGQGQLAGVAGQKSFLVARRVGQQVVSDGFFIAGQRRDFANHASRRQLQRGRTGVIRQHPDGRGLKVVDFAATLPHQSGQRVSGRERTLNVALNLVRMVTDLVSQTGALFGNALLFGLAHYPVGGSGR